MYPYEVMCFFADNISNDGIQHFDTLSAFLHNLSNYSIGTTLCQSLKDELLRICQSVNTLFDYFSSVGDVFEHDKNSSINNLGGPIKVAMDSLLGVFIRTIIAQWECLSFESACILCEEFRLFALDITSGFQLEAVQRLSHCDKVFQYYSAAHSIDCTSSAAVQFPKESYLSFAVAAMNNGDLGVAEEALHRYFDCGAVDFLPSDTVAGALSNLTKAIASINSSPVDSGSGSSKVTPQQQQAMLSLATMRASALSGGTSNQTARAAVEEAMKTAHQRGDDASVARTLLLLYYVLRREKIGSSSTAAQRNAVLEDVLLRCIRRFATLSNAGFLASEAALELVSLRARGPLLVSGHSDISGPPYAKGTGDDAVWSVADLWAQIAVAQLGDAHLIARITRGPSGLGDAEGSSVSVSAPLRGAAAHAQHTADHARISVVAAVVSCDLWCRLGMLHAAELSLRRTIRQYGPSVDPMDAVALFRRYVLVSVDTINLRLVSEQGRGRRSLFIYDGTGPGPVQCTASSHTVGGCPFSKVLSWAQEAQKALFPPDSCVTSPLLKEQFEACVIYARIYQSVARGQWDRGLRLAHRAVDLVCVECEEAQEISETSVRFRLLLAKLLERTDAVTSTQIFADAEAVCAGRGWLQMECAAAAVRYTLEYHSGEASSRMVAATNLKAVLARAHSVHVADVDVVIAADLL